MMEYLIKIIVNTIVEKRNLVFLQKFYQFKVLIFLLLGVILSFNVFSQATPKISFQLSQTEISENSKQIILTAVLSELAPKDVSFDIALGGNARLEEDYDIDFSIENYAIFRLNKKNFIDSLTDNKRLNYKLTYRDIRTLWNFGELERIIRKNGNILFLDRVNNKILEYNYITGYKIYNAKLPPITYCKPYLRGENIYFINYSIDNTYYITRVNILNGESIVLFKNIGYGNSANQLFDPSDLYVDEKENLFICDTQNQRIQKWILGETKGITVIGGNGRGYNMYQMVNPRRFRLNDNKFYYTFNDLALTRWTIGNSIRDEFVINLQDILSFVFNSRNELFISATEQIDQWVPEGFSNKIKNIAGWGGKFKGNFLFQNKDIAFDDEDNLIILTTDEVRVNTNNKIYAGKTTKEYKFLITNDNKLEDVEEVIIDILNIKNAIISGGSQLKFKIKDSPQDSDNDGIFDSIDKCPNTPNGEKIDLFGCSSSQIDSDNDGLFDNVDKCLNTPAGEKVDKNGCSMSQIDSDNDGVFDNLDKCSNTTPGVKVDFKGCSDAQNYCNNLKPNINISSSFEVSTTLIGVNYIWYLNDEVLFEGKLNNFRPINSGKYSLKVLMSDKCLSLMSDYISVLITGSQIESKYLNAYPNPFKREIKVSIPIEYGIDAKVMILDSRGSLVFSKGKVFDNEIIDLNFLSSGTYLMSIESNYSKLKHIIKLVKE